MKKGLLILCTLLLTTSFSSKAQDLFYRNYTVEDGLVSSTVYDIHQDHMGFLWFGTEAGVSKFDGIRFVNYSKKSGLGDNEIFNIVPDQSGRLWFFPFNGRLSYCDQTSFSIIGIEKDSLLANLIIKGTFTNLIEDEAGHVWFGTQKDRKIAYYSPEDTAILIDCAHRKVILEKVESNKLTYRVGKIHYECTLTWRDGAPEIGEPVEIACEVEDEKPPLILEGFRVTDHYIDHENNHWYSTLGQGVIMKPNSEIYQLNHETGLLFDHVYSLLDNPSTGLIVGYHNGKLQQLTEGKSELFELSDHTYNRIIDLAMDDHLWVATDKALFALNPSNFQLRFQYPGAVKCMQIFGDSLYYGTATGLYVVHKKNPELARRIYPQRTISVAVIKSDSIYLGTNQGLRRYNGKDVLAFGPGQAPEILNGRIRSMVRMGDTAILFATAEGLVYKHGFSYELWSSNEIRISSDVCHQLIKENDSTVWLGTNNGLNKLRFHKGSMIPTVDKYDTEHGLLSNYINDIHFGANTVIVATDAGISMLPRISNVKHVPPQAYLLGVSINDNDTSLQSHYDLEHYQNKIKVAFSGIAFEQGKNTKYRYRLLGLHKSWSTTSISEIQFEALRPGNYTFQIVALAADGSESPMPAQITFKVNKPFYAEWWFIGLASLIFLILLALAIRFAVKYMSRKGLEEKNRLLEEKNEIIEFEKQRSEDLLLNILPETTAHELKEYGKVKARQHEGAAVLFSDFKGFTEIAEKLSAEELVNELDQCFRAYDEIIEKYRIEKIKTIGDAYMCATGLNPDTSKDPRHLIDAALEIVAFMDGYAKEKEARNEPHFEVRIGIHYGGVVSGVVGLKKFAFDIWGDTVNTAARMESSGEEGKVNISKSTYELIKDEFECSSRGLIEAKGKGAMEMYFVHKRKADNKPASL